MFLSVITSQLLSSCFVLTRVCVFFFHPDSLPRLLSPCVLLCVCVVSHRELLLFNKVRDYIHVMDVAEGHLCALKKLQDQKRGFFVYNLSRGAGVSVMEMVRDC